MNKKVRILKTHADGEFTLFKKFPEVYDFFSDEILPVSKIIYVKRDGRDILNSLFYYMRSMGITYPSFSEFLRSKNNFDEIFPDLNRVEFLKRFNESWEKVDNKLSLDFSELESDIFDVINRISGFLGIPNKKPVKKIELTKYGKISLGIRRIFPVMFKTTAVLPRKGKTGDWVENFSKEDLEFYKSVMGKI